MFYFKIHHQHHDIIFIICFQPNGWRQTLGTRRAMSLKGGVLPSSGRPRKARIPPFPAYRRSRRFGLQTARNSRMHQREVRSSNPLYSTNQLSDITRFSVSLNIPDISETCAPRGHKKPHGDRGFRPAAAGPAASLWAQNSSFVAIFWAAAPFSGRGVSGSRGRTHQRSAPPRQPRTRGRQDRWSPSDGSWSAIAPVGSSWPREKPPHIC